ncbi:YoaK family protein [Nocardia sp. JMUB6875]
MTSTRKRNPEPFWDLEMRLSAVLSVLAGFIGAAAYTHSAGYFVTFMTGNTERAILGNFSGDEVLAAGAAAIIVCFLAGVFVASICRRHWWTNHPHGATMLTTGALLGAAVVDFFLEERGIGLVPILFVAFGMGALNTSFVKNGEVSIPVSYVTGTLVKFAQGLERHIAGEGDARNWLGYATQYFSFALGALIGGLVSLVIDGYYMLNAAFLGSLIVAAYTWRADIRWVRRNMRLSADEG